MVFRNKDLGIVFMYTLQSCPTLCDPVTQQAPVHGILQARILEYGESNMEIYITVCKIDSQRESAVCLRKLEQELCIDLEGWGGEGREVQKGGHGCIPMADAQ